MSGYILAMNDGRPPLPYRPAPTGFGTSAPGSQEEWLERIQYVRAQYPDLAASIENIPSGHKMDDGYPGSYVTRRILEKHGFLRWYLDSAPAEVSIIVSRVCTASETHCSCCGSSSSGSDVANRSVWGGWYLTVCDACAMSADADPDDFQDRVYPARRLPSSDTEQVPADTPI